MKNRDNMKRHNNSANLAAIACTLVAVLFGARGFSQSSAQMPARPQAPPPAKQDAAQSPAMRVTSRLVQVNVIVQDKDGNPVTGLTKDDFVLLDQGQKQQIATFSEQKSVLTAKSVAAASPNLFTNRFEEGANAQPPLTVIVIDSYAARYWDMHSNMCPPPPPLPPFPLCAVGPIFHEVEKFISHMQPQDRVALYELGDKLYLLQDFTSDASALHRALDRGKQYIPPSFTSSKLDPLDMDAHTMDAMHVIADRLANVPGRKNLVFLSPGFPPTPNLILTTQKIDETSKSLGNADLPVSAVDPLGLNGGDPAIGPVPSGGGGGKGGGHGTLAPPPGAIAARVAMAGRVPRRTDFDFSKKLAELSGGRAYENTNDLAGAIRRVIDASSATYLLGYYPDHNKWNGEFREIKVKVNRPSVEIRARRGYYAVADTASASERNSQKLAEAIRSPLESTDLSLDVQVDAANDSGARQLRVKISLDPSQLHFQQQGDRWTDNVGEYWAEFDGEGHQVGTHSQTLNLRPTLDEYKTFVQKAFSFSETVPIADDAEEVRLVVRDGKEGAIGSVIIPLAKLFAQSATQAPPRN
jgi:VWFA-related protein